MKITFIGGGNMAGALIAGLLQKGYAANNISVVEISAENRLKLEQAYGVKTYADLDPTGMVCDILVLAVKPQQLPALAGDLRAMLKAQLVISIAAGVRLADLRRWLGGYSLLVRAMPNTPAMVMAGVSGLYALPGVAPAQISQADAILAAVGSTLWLEDENQMDAITAISGSGPAYVFYFMEALQQAALMLGLSAEQARRLSLATFSGAAKLAEASPEDPATLRARVTSKGGTTERAIQSMETAGVKQHIMEAARAATERSRELGSELGKL